MKIPKAPVAVVDLEWTAWEGSRARRWTGPGEHREIVQMGAVRLDGGRGLAEIDHLEIVVRPRINPVLSEYFVALTGLTQARVDAEGVAFPEALASLHGFLAGRVETIYCYGVDGVVIEENCRLSGVAFPFEAGLFASVGPFLARALGLSEGGFSSGDLPRLLGFAPPGAAHTALGDARAIAEALRRLIPAAPG